ncbi:type II toxin-antitoxin system HicB family antitoxin [Mannheimia pernigra]|uniref:Type II toxin-antitoxin system HicB family antitoxin n=1 Tax=Mannheimia pernigra TaxID=111844 RepID=A0A7H8UV07_9PAST|nr:type II toxin-antitoxin system HicB family antitoxin [Mannheimia pernigra]QLB40796.1 type II toxin-antitoxin system HicB family antitoxin [Mannheimia pernigra]QLB44417.1 type II toxin-antitoxin system HicB family antitoxin [Mannheimia pernigra]
MFYPALFTPAEEGGFVVTFPDIPEALTQGDTFEEAMEMAEDVLISSVEIYFDDERVFPLSRPTGIYETSVFMPESVYAKILLHNTMCEKFISKAEVSRLNNIKPPEIHRILNPRHTTRIDTIGRILVSLGRPLQLSLA